MGQFSVSADASAVKAFVAKQGSPKAINISLLTTDAKGNFSVYDTTAAVDDAKSGRISVNSASPDPMSLNTVPDGAAHTAAWQSTVGNSRANRPMSQAKNGRVTLRLAPATHSAVPTRSANAAPPVTANSAYTRLSNLGNRATLVGALFSTGGTGWDGTVEYSKGQGSEIGVGVSGQWQGWDVFVQWDK
ncbi:hypothetical protein [Calidifontibacter terrae]